MMFMLTDGATISPDECLEEVKNKKDNNTQIHSFGIGNDCDTGFCERLAESGDGVC
jgi:hypothetical protein